LILEEPKVFLKKSIKLYKDKPLCYDNGNIINMLSIMEKITNYQDYTSENLEVEYPNGQKKQIKSYLLRIYLTTFNECDAYMDIPKTQEFPTFVKVYFKKVDTWWIVIQSPQDAPIRGMFRGEYSENNPPAWVFYLRKIR